MCVLLLSSLPLCRTQPCVRGASVRRGAATQETCSKLSGRAGNQTFLLLLLLGALSTPGSTKALQPSVQHTVQ